jgi:hypothetical protein
MLHQYFATPPAHSLCRTVPPARSWFSAHQNIRALLYLSLPILLYIVALFHTMQVQNLCYSLKDTKKHEKFLAGDIYFRLIIFRAFID